MQIERDVVACGNQLRRIDQPVICGKVTGQVTILGTTRSECRCAIAAACRSGTEKSRAFVWKCGSFSVSLFIDPVSDAVFVGRAMWNVANANVVGHSGKLRSNLNGTDPGVL